MPDLTPMTREEKFLNGDTDLTPITRREHFYAGTESELPEPDPITREEWFIKKYRGGGGGDITVESLSVTENGTYTAPSGKAYSPVEVDVPLPSNAYLLKSVTTPTPIASFTDGEEMVMPSLKVAIEPQQEGSGDPSPTNIRPISGWDEVNVVRTGKNLFDATNLINDRTIDTNGDLSGYGGRVATPDYIPVKPNTSIYLSYSKTVSQNVVFIYALYKDGTLISRVANNPMGAVIQTENANQIRFAFYDSISASDLYNIQLEYGNTATSYESYNPNSTTYTIDLDGTRYGGKLDVVSGIFTPAPYYASYNGETLTGEWISDRDKYEVGATPTIGAQVVNIGASGTPVSILPTAVKSLRGVNNVYANTGDIKDAEYFSKEAE